MPRFTATRPPLGHCKSHATWAQTQNGLSYSIHFPSGPTCRACGRGFVQAGQKASRASLRCGHTQAHRFQLHFRPLQQQHGPTTRTLWKTGNSTNKNTKSQTTRWATSTAISPPKPDSSFGFPWTTAKRRRSNFGNRQAFGPFRALILAATSTGPVLATHLFGWPWSPQHKNCSAGSH